MRHPHIPSSMNPIPGPIESDRLFSAAPVGLECGTHIFHMSKAVVILLYVR